MAIKFKKENKEEDITVNISEIIGKKKQNTDIQKNNNNNTDKTDEIKKEKKLNSSEAEKTEMKEKETKRKTDVSEIKEEDKNEEETAQTAEEDVFEELPDEIKDELKLFEPFFKINFKNISKDEVKEILNYFINKRAEEKLADIAEVFSDALIQELKRKNYFNRVENEAEKTKIIKINETDLDKLIEKKEIPQTGIKIQDIKKRLLLSENFIKETLLIYRDLFEGDKNREYFCDETVKAIEKKYFFEDFFDIDFMK